MIFFHVKKTRRTDICVNRGTCVLSAKERTDNICNKLYAVAKCLFPLKIHMLKSQSPKMMVFGGGFFGRCYGNEGGAFMNGINTLIKETPLSLLALPPGRLREGTGYEPGRGPPPESDQITTLTLRLPRPQNSWKINLLFISHLVWAILLEQPKWTKRHTLSSW